MSAESPRHVRSGGPLTVPSQPPSDRSIIDTVSGFINDVTLSSSSTVDPKDVIQWARFETADINEPTPEGDGDNDISPLLLILGYGSGVQVWLIPPSGEAQEVLSWRQGTVRVLRILPTPQHGDCFASKRPLIALCDSASPGPTFCSLSFISIRGGEQVKSIKFKNPILDVLANKRSVVVSFSERFAVFDAATLEDRMTVTTCYPCPCPLGGSAPINPLALGDRWLAYADKKLNQSKRSSGGCEGEGVTSYTATVLHAAKSLSKGLRGLGESVAHSLAGGRTASQSPSPPHADTQQPGLVTVLDIESNDDDDGQDIEEPYDPIVAHFVAHSEAIIALKFDASGMLLVTADRRGHDFHVFRINPHPCGPNLASVHHLYILHRGDTTAKVQDIAISWDARWAAVSTLRGTTHVFALSPYGGAAGVRTHTQPRLVNRLSRFHRSAGLPIHAAAAAAAAASTSPVTSGSQGAWFPNPRLPPYPLPTWAAPLAQLRPTNLPTHTITRTSSGRQRLSSLSEDSNSAPLLARARFGMCISGSGSVSGSGRAPAPVAALYLMTANGALLHLLLHPRPASSIPKEKICDDSPIELEVEPIAQWPLQRPPAAADLLAPLPPSNPLLQPHTYRRCADMCMSEEERWLSQVEIVTHAGPHRRLWMGPQFVFKTYSCTGSSSSLSEAETVEVEAGGAGVARSTPVNMPAARPLVPVLVDSGSASSLEQSPLEGARRKSLVTEYRGSGSGGASGGGGGVCDVQLREDLAEAMKEDHGWPREREAEAEAGAGSGRAALVERAVDPLGCVVASPPVAPPPPLDADLYTRDNRDEATFRPVVRAPAALPPHPPVLARPLPRTTTIPVQSLPAAPPRPPQPPQPSQPLPTDVVIPAALSRAWPPPTAWARVADPAHGDREPDLSQSLPKSSRSPDIQPAAPLSVSKSPTRETCRDDELSYKRSGPIEAEEFEPDTVSQSSVPRDVRERSENKEIREPVESKQTKETGKVRKVSGSRDTRESSIPRVKESKEIRKSRKSSDSVEVKDDLKNKEFGESKELKSKHKRTNDPWEIQVPSTSHEYSTSINIKGPNVSREIKESSIPRETKEFSMFREEGEPKTPRKNRESKREVKEISVPIEIEKTSIPREVKESSIPREMKESKTSRDKESSVQREIKEPVKNRDMKGMSENKETKIKEYKTKSVASMFQQDEEYIKDDLKISDNKELLVSKEDQSISTTVKSWKKGISHIKSKEWQAHDIKTEDQAWDMLLSEAQKPAMVNISQQAVDSDKSSEESKPKSKRNRKVKKAQDDRQIKVEEDSFVEIHAIEDKQQSSSGELVSISTPYEDAESSSFYLPKTRKSRGSKSVTPEKIDATEKTVPEIVNEESLTTIDKYNRSEVKDKDALSEFGTLSDYSAVLKCKEKSKDKLKPDAKDEFVPECVSLSLKETLRSKKSKSLSPYTEARKSAERCLDTETKDVYVIDTTKEEFPEIQITRGKPRKKSPQPIEKKNTECEMPVKSWSSIAASKGNKKVEETEKKVEVVKKVEAVSLRDELRDAACFLDDNIESSKDISLQEKLYEICKRTDIMVAECDAPSELNFVEEHHAVLHDLPPLEPLGFGLDDFKLEVMRDSLLDIHDTKITSPICKINIDDILSSIKETTSKVIESSTFNLIDLEKVPAKREKGFSVIESHKITSQEVGIDDEPKSDDKDAEIMEKSSDDDGTSPVVSTDSDKDDKKGAGTSKTILPSAKQFKSKKSRRKKK
ncbi:uncharacterized protein LOC113523466 [Galleria mellonella]|uniref:Uncharacterized protein LOC113523466 n=1 Tax=Galleria mellonella TaxID=7137 RepID=A0ABM3MK47_GALME|nr:uncharacterized protein LOC113523466 [Galleria mellonella]XP_052751586.1 uncharacterized protein LOC113523466 [Galleria mellonella]